MNTRNTSRRNSRLFRSFLFLSLTLAATATHARASVPSTESPANSVAISVPAEAPSAAAMLDTLRQFADASPTASMMLSPTTLALEMASEAPAKSNSQKMLFSGLQQWLQSAMADLQRVFAHLQAAFANTAKTFAGVFTPSPLMAEESAAAESNSAPPASCTLPSVWTIAIAPSACSVME